MKLPATRELARTLDVNRGTVAEAYEELVAAGWARAHVGQGTFVAERPEAPGTSLRPASDHAGHADPAPSAAAPLNWPALLSQSAQITAAEDERAPPLANAAASNPLPLAFAGGMPVDRIFPP